MRITDRLLSSENIFWPRWMGNLPQDPAEVRSRLNPPFPVIDATNVAHYVFEGTDQEQFDYQKDFPNVAPPFDHFVVEFSMPMRSVSRELGVSIASLPLKVVVLIDHVTRVEGRSVPTGYLATMFCECPPGRFVGPMAFVRVTLNEDGSMVGKSKWQTISAVKLRDEEWLDGLSGLMFPVYLSLSFIHCRSTEIVEVKQPEKLIRARERKGKKSEGLRYYVLDIEPAKKILREQGNSDSVGIAQALHVCRGHFKDYRQGGLFGQHKGIFWFGPHIRGNAENGEVSKDYRVSAPDSPGGE